MAEMIIENWLTAGFSLVDNGNAELARKEYN